MVVTSPRSQDNAREKLFALAAFIIYKKMLARLFTPTLGFASQVYVAPRFPPENSFQHRPLQEKRTRGEINT